MMTIFKAIFFTSILCWPGLSTGMDFAEARHLMARLEFGPTFEEIDRFSKLTYEDAVQTLLEGVRRDPITSSPKWADESLPDFRKIRAMSQSERRVFQKERRKKGIELKSWWYQEMLETDSPLTERMTLFWHNHFTSSLQKVRAPTLLYQQNLLLREHALGNFRDLVHAIARDPAMTVYLDNQSNRKRKPNENFARELLELFTLGEGHYTEQDIKEAARAFTGWMLNRSTGQFIFRKRVHDDGEKEFMGRRGKWNGDDIVNIVLEQSRVSVFVTEKLWREFISDVPDETEVDRLAEIFRKGDYEIKPLLKALFTSSHFRDPKIRGTLIKSPVELIVGTLRTFKIPLQNTRMLVKVGRALGQDLFDPPNVKGWRGGTAWIDSTTLLIRRQLLHRLVRGDEMRKRKHAKNKAQPWGLKAFFQNQQLERIQKVLLPFEPLSPIPKGSEVREAIQHLLLDPAYQLK